MVSGQFYRWTNKRKLAQLLANLATQQGSQAAQGQQAIGQAQAGGIMGRSNAIGSTIGTGLGLAAAGGLFGASPMGGSVTSPSISAANLNISQTPLGLNESMFSIGIKNAKNRF